MLTAKSTRDDCPTFDRYPTLADKLCLRPLWAVLQAILNLANPNGSTQGEIIAELPNVCTLRVYTTAQVIAALADGVARSVLLERPDIMMATRYCVNRNMTLTCPNQELYDDFKSQIWCPECTPCPTECIQCVRDVC